MTIIDILKKEVPKNRSAKRIDELYELTKRLVPEIEEAKRCGYSWAQICNAVKEIESKEGRWREDWRRFYIEENYRRIKREGEQK